ncbi:GTPase/DUF3482 domain-containing protein [Desulfopila sp. IMCC35008]|uniref:GTPase/DUF3482 domain-containing protein n=1 Tax=Desulfopila sp. IMCC35008 TaxID=2653858 RepID=UPI0013D32204|nr:GTPase/DUF3482 domain-containing protein [Desulfopila sp. IMCC35008]
MNAVERSPEIAIIGHPNEGKSSVLSTLAEDDSVRVSATPGETVVCRTFPVRIDGREVLRFTDTPGFQNPSRVLAELRKLTEEDGDCITRFREKFQTVPELHDDIELLQPIERGAGIIYVVDGSRPVRNVDRAEMEILRLSGRPRMAIINCKDDRYNHLDSWKNEFRKTFNSNRVFNAHRATYAERILLLEALKSIDQDWHPILDKVVVAFKDDWASRNRQTMHILLDLFTDCLQYTVSAPLNATTDQEELQKQLTRSYHKTIGEKEKKAHRRIRGLYKHNIFDYSLPAHSLLHEELFSEKTWSVMGLSKTQIVIIGGLGAAAIGAGIDIAAGGMALGLVTGLAGAAGAIGALWGGKKLSQDGVFGVRIGGEQLRLGPATDINLLFVLINRALLYYKHTINWAHGRRDYENISIKSETENHSFNITSNWSTARLRICSSFFSAVTGKKENNIGQEKKKLGEIIERSLAEISSEE